MLYVKHFWHLTICKACWKTNARCGNQSGWSNTSHRILSALFILWLYLVLTRTVLSVTALPAPRSAPRSQRRGHAGPALLAASLSSVTGSVPCRTARRRPAEQPGRHTRPEEGELATVRRAVPKVFAARCRRTECCACPAGPGLTCPQAHTVRLGTRDGEPGPQRHEARGSCEGLVSPQDHRRAAGAVGPGGRAPRQTQQRPPGRGTAAPQQEAARVRAPEIPPRSYKSGRYQWMSLQLFSSNPVIYAHVTILVIAAQTKCSKIF